MPLSPPVMRATFPRACRCPCDMPPWRRVAGASAIRFPAAAIAFGQAPLLVCHFLLPQVLLPRSLARNRATRMPTKAHRNEEKQSKSGRRQGSLFCRSGKFPRRGFSHMCNSGFSFALLFLRVFLAFFPASRRISTKVPICEMGRRRRPSDSMATRGRSSSGRTGPLWTAPTGTLLSMPKPVGACRRKLHGIARFTCRLRPRRH